MNDGRKYLPVEQFLDIYDENRYWMYIPGWNGYEVSNDGYLRSMKHFARYPYGILIRPKTKNGVLLSPQDPIFELSDNNNERQRVHLSQLMHLAITNPYIVSGYPRKTWMSDRQSRNDRHFVNKKLKVPPLDKDAHYAKFTIIDEDIKKDTFGDVIKKDYKDIKLPVGSLEGDTYYGRTDCGIRCSGDVQE